MQPALATLANCVTAPPSLAHLMNWSEKPTPRKKPARQALQTPEQAPDTAARAAPELALASSMEVRLRA